MQDQSPNSINAIQTQIDSAFHQVEQAISNLPLNDKGKSYVWLHTFTCFYDQPVLAEDNTTTYGITSLWQLQNFIRQFNQNLKILDVTEVRLYLEALNTLPSTEAEIMANRKLLFLKSNKIDAEYLGELFSPKDQLYISHLEELRKYPTQTTNYRSEVSPIKVTSTDRITIEATTFKEIFIDEAWEKYISVFEKTVPPLLTKDWQFQGRSKGHRGVICSWIKELQIRGKINQKINRRQLAKILNAEIKDFNIGSDGKTFDNVSSTYTSVFENQIQHLLK
jgi:hypothetical protein